MGVSAGTIESIRTKAKADIKLMPADSMAIAKTALTSLDSLKL